MNKDRHGCQGGGGSKEPPLNDMSSRGLGMSVSAFIAVQKARVAHFGQDSFRLSSRCSSQCKRKGPLLLSKILVLLLFSALVASLRFIGWLHFGRGCAAPSLCGLLCVGSTARTRLRPWSNEEGVGTTNTLAGMPARAARDCAAHLYGGWLASSTSASLTRATWRSLSIRNRSRPSGAGVKRVKPSSSTVTRPGDERPK